MTIDNPLTDEQLTTIERDIETGDLTHGQVRRLIAEIRRQRSVLDQVDESTKRIDAGLDRVSGQVAELHTALAHLDRIIAAYQSTNALGPMLLAISEAKEWRGVRD